MHRASLVFNNEKVLQLAVSAIQQVMSFCYSSEGRYVVLVFGTLFDGANNKSASVIWIKLISFHTSTLV